MVFQANISAQNRKCQIYYLKNVLLEKKWAVYLLWGLKLPQLFSMCTVGIKAYVLLLFR